MLISHSQKKIFISIPKTGSTSIMFALNPLSIHFNPDIYHASYKEICKFNNKLIFNPDLIFNNNKYIENFYISNYKVYAVVRDPLLRLISVYADSKKDKNHVTLKSISKKKTVNHFLEYYLKNNFFSLPRHLWPQSYFVNGVDKKKLYLYKFDNLNTCFVDLYSNNILKRIFAPKLPHMRKTNSEMLVKEIDPNLLLSLKNNLNKDYDLYNSSPNRNFINFL
jgi:hypothetical protein